MRSAIQTGGDTREDARSCFVEDAAVSRLERSTVLTLVLIAVLAACGALVQIVSAQWAPLQRMFLGF